MSSPTELPVRPTAVVVGGSRGLGLAVARELDRRGHRLVLLARDAEELERAAEQLSPGTASYPCDVRDREALVARLRLVEQQAPIEVLVYVAGVISVAPAEEVSLADFDACHEVMLRGMVDTVWTVLPAMRGRGRGRIGLVTSVGGRVPAPHLLPYTTAKFGAQGFGLGLATELQGTGVTATVFAPGLMRTGGHEHAEFQGDTDAEYSWFATAAALPVVSADADRAARKLVDGLLKGRPHVELTPLARIGSRVAAVAPATTVRLTGLVDRVLPGPTDDDHRETGRTIDRRQHGPVMDPLLALGRRAVRRHGNRDRPR
ncbi:MAG TPA: SDR family NAD(P)-dependent oxidoreductase [Nocardioides sp.]